MFKDNTTSIYAYATALQMTNTNFIDNQIGLTFVSNVYDSIYISDCQFLNNVLALNYPNKGTVQNCLFNDNTTAIQAAYKCEIFNNQFMYNELALEATVNADIHDNQINNNFGGLLISNVSSAQDSPLIYNNEICSNTIFNVNNNTNMNYSLLSNCFCGLDSAAIEQYLLDGYDDITKGLINYSLYDTTCTSVLGTVRKFQEQTSIVSENGIENLTFNNPVADYLVVKNNIDIPVIYVESLLGNDFTIYASTTNTFDLGNLPSGIYFVRFFVNSNSSSSQKIIKL